MQSRPLRAVTAALALAVGLSACGSAPPTHQAEQPAQVDHIDGSELSRVTLTAKAIERIALETAVVSEESGRTVVPYSSLIYDPHGQTWVYTSPQPRTFVRAKVEVAEIDGDRAFLSSGPAIGAQVASVGVAELYGTEFEVGH